MNDVIYLRGEGGGIFPMSLPLNPHIERRLKAHELARVNEDGTEYTGPADEDEADEEPEAPAPGSPAAAGKASK